MSVPTNVGATIQRTLPQRPVGDQDIFYVRDSNGLWHYWDFSGRNLRLSDEEMAEKVEESGIFKVVSTGYVPPVPEPSGDGAVVEVGDHVRTRFVRVDNDDNEEVWAELPFDNIFVDWDFLLKQSNLRVLSQGVN